MEYSSIYELVVQEMVQRELWWEYFDARQLRYGATTPIHKFTRIFTANPPDNENAMRRRRCHNMVCLNAQGSDNARLTPDASATGGACNSMSCR